MDASAWVAAVSGLIGAGIGGLASIRAAAHAQKGQLLALERQVRAERELMIAQRVDGAVDTAIEEFYALRQHLGRRPHPESSDDAIWDGWERSTWERTSKLGAPLLQIRNQSLRERLTTLLDYLNAAPAFMDPSFGGDPGLPDRLCDYALRCLGAYLRDEPLPLEDEVFARATTVRANLRNSVMRAPGQREGLTG